MLKPILMMLAMTVMILLDTSDANAYAVADDTNGDAKMPNVARHLASAYAVLLMPPLLPMQMLLWQLMRVDACDDVILEFVYMCLFCLLPECVCGLCMCPCACVHFLCGSSCALEPGSLSDSNKSSPK